MQLRLLTAREFHCCPILILLSPLQKTETSQKKKKKASWNSLLSLPSNSFNKHPSSTYYVKHNPAMQGRHNDVECLGVFQFEMNKLRHITWLAHVAKESSTNLEMKLRSFTQRCCLSKEAFWLLHQERFIWTGANLRERWPSPHSPQAGFRRKGSFHLGGCSGS